MAAAMPGPTMAVRPPRLPAGCRQRRRARGPRAELRRPSAKGCGADNERSHASRPPIQNACIEPVTHQNQQKPRETACDDDREEHPLDHEMVPLADCLK